MSFKDIFQQIAESRKAQQKEKDVHIKWNLYG